MKLGIGKGRINFSFVNTPVSIGHLRNTSRRKFILLPKLLMFRYPIKRAITLITDSHTIQILLS